MLKTFCNVSNWSLLCVVVKQELISIVASAISFVTAVPLLGITGSEQLHTETRWDW